MIAIINYGSGNVAAIYNIYKRLGIAASVTSDPSELGMADRYILPGVGSFDFTMNQLHCNELMRIIEDQLKRKSKPLLGICVGMQVLAQRSDEGVLNGLDWIGGHVCRIEPKSTGVRVPHMGWNSITIKSDQMGLFRNVDPLLGFYFLHSYHFIPKQPESILAITNYGEEMVCSVSNHYNIFGVQFHPEKSHDNGIELLRNFSSI